MKPKPILFLLIILFFSYCSKDNKDCWQAFYPGGHDLEGLVVCDKTEAEAEAAYPEYWFYKQGEEKYCWQVEIGTRTYYTSGVPESMANKQMSINAAYHYTKINCESFCNCVWLEKHK
ncbi:MAG TPA: hypothetical protein VN958_09140, partial [Chitinophagaceae bacterium]|nr:hypothetical protein [Chitinophagaceae bacterium]